VAAGGVDRARSEPWQGRFSPPPGDPVAARTLGLQTLSDLRLQQAAALSHLDVFWLMGMGALLLCLTVFAMRRSVAEADAHPVE